MAFILKCDMRLKLRCHMRRQVVTYASDDYYLDEAPADQRGWAKMLVPPMTLLVFQRPNVCAPFTGHFEFILQTTTTATGSSLIAR